MADLVENDNDDEMIQTEFSPEIVFDKKLPTGPATGTYHNPETGQEFHGLPVDSFSREHYEKRHRLRHDPEQDGSKAFGARLVFGPAPPHLKEKWEQIKHEQTVKSTVRGGNSYQNDDLVTMVAALSEQVKQLQSQLNDKAVSDIIEVEKEEIEQQEYEYDTQIPMFDLAD